jgi:hypothetical protein
MAWNFFSNNVAHSLAKAAVPARWVSVVSTPLILFITSNNLTSTQWSTGLTAIGALLGIYGAWLTLEIFRIGDKFSQQQNKLIEEVHRSVMTGLKVQHAHELRRKYEDAKDEGPHLYWHFVWRFETQDFLGLSLKPNGFVRVHILGSNNKAMETNLERLEIPIYTVDVYEVQENEELHNGRAYCWCLNGRTFISNNANAIELQQPSIEFEIVGLGPIRGGSVGPRPMNYKRLKDLNDPTSGDGDQG